MTAALDRLLSTYAADLRPTRDPIPLGNAGGGSGASLWRFDSARGPLVARAYPPDGPGLAGIVAVHDWLSLLAGFSFIPIPLSTRDGRTAVALEGRIWDLAPWLPGAPSSGRSDVAAGLRALGLVHDRLSRLSAEAPSPGLIARRDEAGRLLAGELDRMEEAVLSAPPSPSRDLARRWLGAAGPGLAAILPGLRVETGRPRAVQPILRDARAEHFLFDGGRLSGLVDFAAMGRDAPPVDLARLLPDWVGRDPGARAEAIAAYEAARPLRPGDPALIETFEAANAWLGPARWVRWAFVERRPFDDPEAVVRGLGRTLDRLADWVASTGARLRP